MAIRDVREALDQAAGDNEVQIIVKAGRAQLTITAGNNRVTIKTDKSLETEKVVVTGKDHVFHMEDESLGSAVTVLSQINEA